MEFIDSLPNFNREIFKQKWYIPPTMLTQFKGWTIPGKAPQPANPPAPHDEETLDALSGFYKIFQLKKGHRYSTDDVLVAWYATSHCGQVERALDLGSGLSSVAMMCAWKLKDVHFTTIEAQAVSFELSKKSVSFNQLTDRFFQIHGDFRESEQFLTDQKFDLITGTPPYFDVKSGLFGNHDQKIKCRFETRGSIVDYCQAASRHLAPAGVFITIFPSAFETQWISELSGFGLSLIKKRPVQFKEGEAPLLTLYLLMRTIDLPEAFLNSLPKTGHSEPALIIRTKEGKIHPEYSVAKLSVGFPP